MKGYFNFTLKGIHFLPVWIAFFIFFIIPVNFMFREFNELIAAEVPAGGPSKIFFLYLLLVLIMAFVFTFVLTKLTLQSVEFKGVKVKCDYNIAKYIGIVISGLVLSVITFFIYLPWFFTNMYRFFVEGASYNSHKFEFRGVGRHLFIIMTLTIVIPFLVVGFILFTLLKSEIDIWIYQLIVVSSIVANIYVTFRWMVDIQFKDYQIKLKTEFFPAIGKILTELVLAVILVLVFQWLTSFFIVLLWNPDAIPAAGEIAVELILAVTTLSIYFAMAFIRLYRYFAKHTKSNIVEGKQITMGYVGDQFSDFKFMWKQLLLTVITFGIYFPWAFSQVVTRVLTQTYLTTDFIVEVGEK
jgi:uncharacterized membrane protein YjgN (DUF898 family)